MAAVALANPLIYYDSSPFEAWALLPVGAVIIAAALFGVLALMSPARAKAAWPATPIKSAWFILVLMLLANWQGYRALPAPPEISAPQSNCKPGATKIDDFLDDCQR